MAASQASGRLPEAVLYVPKGKEPPPEAAVYFDAVVREGEEARLAELLSCPLRLSMEEWVEELPLESVFSPKIAHLGLPEWARKKLVSLRGVITAAWGEVEPAWAWAAAPEGGGRVVEVRSPDGRVWGEVAVGSGGEVTLRVETGDEGLRGRRVKVWLGGREVGEWELVDWGEGRYGCEGWLGLWEGEGTLEVALAVVAPEPWKHGRLPEGVRRHLETCKSCQEAFREALEARRRFHRAFCPDAWVLAAYARGESSEEVKAWEPHLSRCPACRVEVRVLQRTEV
jgi:hypothetical protein